MQARGDRLRFGAQAQRREGAGPRRRSPGRGARFSAARLARARSSPSPRTGNRHRRLPPVVRALTEGTQGRRFVAALLLVEAFTIRGLKCHNWSRDHEGEDWLPGMPASDRLAGGARSRICPGRADWGVRMSAFASLSDFRRRAAGAAGLVVVACGSLALAGCGPTGGPNFGVNDTTMAAPTTPVQVQPLNNTAPVGETLGAGPVRVGVILPLTQGGGAEPGRRLAAQRRRSWRWRNRAANDVTLMILDDHSTPDGAAQATAGGDRRGRRSDHRPAVFARRARSRRASPKPPAARSSPSRPTPASPRAASISCRS